MKKRVSIERSAQGWSFLLSRATIIIPMIASTMTRLMRRFVKVSSFSAPSS